MSRKRKQPHAGRRLAAVFSIALLAGVASVFVSHRRSPSPAATPAQGSLQPDAKVFSGFAGSQSCRGCHTQAFDFWSKSHHAVAERNVDLAMERDAFEPGRSVQHGTQTSEVRRAGNELQLITAARDGQRTPFTLQRVIGVAPLRQFLAPAPGGRFQVTELAFDPAQRGWFDIYGNEDRRPGEWGHWTGRGMTWNQMCASCHNTRLRKHHDIATDSYATTMAERGVGCESCHGPMAEHVKWQKPRPQPAKGDPTLRKLDHSQTMAACGSCHARRSELTGEFEAGQSFLDHFLLTIPDESDIYFADGQVRDEDYEYASFLSSKMFTSGVWCMDCHEPHSAKVRATDNSLCVRCHGTPLPPAPKIVEAEHTFHAAGELGSRCVDCHMPQTTYMQRHARRDHGFTIPDPLLTKEHGIPNACNRCHADKTVDWSIVAVEKWYGKRMERPTRVRAQAIARARGGDTNAISDLIRTARADKTGLWRAAATRLLGEFPNGGAVSTALFERVIDDNPLVRAHAAHALGPLVRAGDAGAIASGQRLLKDDVRAVRIEAAWALHESVDTNSPAGREMTQSMLFNCDQPAGAAQFGSFLMARGDAKSALPWFEKAVAWDTHSAPLHDALAVCLSALGRSSEAVRELEEACRIAPRDAQYRYKLGLALSEANRLNNAVAALEESVKLDPNFAVAWYNLGLGYSQQNRAEEALNALTRAESLDSNSARIPYARATILARTGRIEEARQASARALELQREFTEARQLFEMLGK